MSDGVRSQSAPPPVLPVASEPSLKRGPSIGNLLLVANAFILLLPVFAAVFLHLWDGHLVRLTEHELIAQSVLIGEAWRERLWTETAPADAPRAATLAPIVPLLPLNYDLAPPVPAPQRIVPPDDGPTWRAGAAVRGLMERAKRSNLSTARVLDARGCVVATTGSDLGACLDAVPEIRTALSGRYAAVARERVRRPAAAALGGVSRRGAVRVFTATPVQTGHAVLGVVYMSRTSASPLEAVWDLRYTVAAALGLCLSLTVLVSVFFSRRIARPVHAITTAASAIARGEPAPSLVPGGFVPAEVAALGAALERMTGQLTDRAAYIAQFATTVSHELKTPITAIRGAVELLREAWGSMSEAQRERFLANIDADAARMERLVNRLLELARIQAAPEAGSHIALEPFCRDLVARYGGQVHLDMTGAPAGLTMHPDHLESALRNLLDNAVRHGAGGRVDLRVRADSGRVVFQIRDRGTGISAGNRDRIFDRFFTTERDRGGTGLGLAIVKAVADIRGGGISVDTGPDGTMFTLVV